MVRSHASAPPSRLAAFLQPRGRGSEAIHDLHRDLRRSRFEGQILGRVLGAAPGDRSLERPAGLRDFERALGRWRDVELTRDLWRSAATRPSVPSETKWLAARGEKLEAEMRVHEASAVRLLREVLAGPGTASTSRAPPRRLRRLEAPERWRRELEVRRRRYLRALKKIDRRLPAEPAHAFRQELRRLGVFYDLLAAAPWAAPPRRPPKVQRALDRLGRVHDLDRAIARLAREAKGPIRDAFELRLRAKRRRAADRARRALRSRAIRRYAEGSVRRKK